MPDECAHNLQYEGTYRRVGCVWPLIVCKLCDEEWIDFDNLIRADLDHVRKVAGEAEYHKAIEMLAKSKFAKKAAIDAG